MSKAQKHGKKIMITMTALGFRFCRYHSQKHTEAVNDPNIKIIRIPDAVVAKMYEAQKQASWLHTSLAKLWQEDNDKQDDPVQKKRSFKPLPIFQTKIRCMYGEPDGVCGAVAVVTWDLGNPSIMHVCQNHHEVILSSKPDQVPSC